VVLIDVINATNVCVYVWTRTAQLS